MHVGQLKGIDFTATQAPEWPINILDKTKWVILCAEEHQHLLGWPKVININTMIDLHCFTTITLPTRSHHVRIHAFITDRQPARQTSGQSLC